MITLHHLNHSRSTRILWLLEEIGTPYDVVWHERLPGFRAPDALKGIHPSGKAPLLVDDALVIAESGVILSYLDETYAGGRFTPEATASRLAHAEWMWFAESGASQPLMTMLYAGMTEGLSGVFGQIAVRDADAALGTIDRAITGRYLFEESLTLADVQMSYTLELANHLGLLSLHPNLGAYLDRLKARPALRRAIEVGGPMMPVSPTPPN
ncbi:glutathione S-transferase family protein [Sphingomonas sp. UYP23]